MYRSCCKTFIKPRQWIPPRGWLAKKKRSSCTMQASKIAAKIGRKRFTLITLQVYMLYFWEVWHVDAFWPHNGIPFSIRQLQPGKTLPVSQECKCRKPSNSADLGCLVASSILTRQFGSIKLFPPWCILLVRLCDFSSLQNNIAFFWYHEPPCLNKPITLTLIQGWPIDPDPFSSRLYYDQWHSPNLPSQLNDVDPGSGIVNKNLLGWTPKNYISPWFSLKTREISLFKWE